MAFAPEKNTITQATLSEVPRWGSETNCAAGCALSGNISPFLSTAVIQLRTVISSQLDRLVYWITSPGSDFWTAIAAIVAAVSALIAAISTYLSFLLIRAQNEPHVVIYVKHDESRPSILMIVIENVGNTIASDLSFALSVPLPIAFGMDDESTATELSRTMARGPLVTGIPTLGPKDSRKINWGQYHALDRALSGKAVTITCRYKHGKRQMPPVSAALEVNSFAETAAVQSEGVNIIRELKRIADALGRR